MESTGSIVAAEGNEIQLYDYHRTPRCWSEIILPTQCAVFLRNTKWGVPIDRNGKPRNAQTGTCILFDNIQDAERFCRQLVSENLDVSCEVLDSYGRENPPLLVVTQKHIGGDDDIRGWFANHRKLTMWSLVVAALPMFAYDFTGHGDGVLSVIGINLIVAALRVLMWEVSAKKNEKDRAARLEIHRGMERNAANQPVDPARQDAV